MENQSQLFAGRYELAEELGRGGFSVVHRARDVRTGASVAVKILQPLDTGEYHREMVARFEREISLVAQLRHPNTVRMLDYGRTADGLMYMVSEYLPGEDLFELMNARGTLPRDVVVHILMQLLGSLAEAHARGLLHRDIKPENIRVFQHGSDPFTVKLLDFGIARRIHQAGTELITAAGAVVGTPRYMSPEQLLDRGLGPSSDLYSLGLVAYEMLLGSQVLHGSSLSDQFERLKVERLGAEGQLRQKIGPQLERVLERMTARDPANRFQSAEAVIAALRNPGYSVSATRREPLRPEPSQGSPQFPVRWLVGGAVALALISSVATALILRGTEPKPEVVIKAPPQNLGALVNSGSEEPAQPSQPEPVADSSRDLGVADDLDGCGKPAPFEGFGVLESMMTGRQWLTFVPESYDPKTPTPVVFLFHPDGQTGTRIVDQTAFAKLAEEQGIILLAPDYWMKGDANPLGGAWAWRDAADPEVLREMLDATGESLCVDDRRVFGVGHGAGGNVIQRLACSPWITALASNGFRPDSTEPVCAESSPKPMIIFNPLASKRLPVEGPPTCFVVANPVSLKDQEEMWRRHNACSSKRSKTVSEKLGKCFEYKDCEAKLVSCHVEGGYGWPGSPQFRELDFTGSCTDETVDFPATTLIWEFFESVAPAE